MSAAGEPEAEDGGGVHGVVAEITAEPVDDVTQEPDIVDVLHLGRPVAGDAAFVPVVRVAVGVGDDEAVLVGEAFQVEADAAADPVTGVAGAVDDQDDRHGSGIGLVVQWGVGGPGAVPIVDGGGVAGDGAGGGGVVGRHVGS